MTIYQIEPVTIAAGDSLAMQFEFVNSNNTIPDFTDYNAYYVLSPYGFEDENALSKAMELADDSKNIFKVMLNSDDTFGLEYGTYTVKIILENEGNYYKKARGIFNIKKDNNTVEVTM